MKINLNQNSESFSTKKIDWNNIQLDMKEKFGKKVEKV